MDFDYINVNQICSLKGHSIKKNTSYEYRKSVAKKTIFGKIKHTKEGFYYYDDYYRTIQEIEASGELFVKGEEVFYKPYIVATMSNKETHTKRFNTKDEMFEFMCKSSLSKIDWINRKSILERREVLLEKYKGYSDEYRILSKRSLERQ